MAPCDALVSWCLKCFLSDQHVQFRFDGMRDLFKCGFWWPAAYMVQKGYFSYRVLVWAHSIGCVLTDLQACSAITVGCSRLKSLLLRPCLVPCRRAGSLPAEKVSEALVIDTNLYVRYLQCSAIFLKAVVCWSRWNRVVSSKHSPLLLVAVSLWCMQHCWLCYCCSCRYRCSIPQWS